MPSFATRTYSRIEKHDKDFRRGRDGNESQHQASQKKKRRGIVISDFQASTRRCVVVQRHYTGLFCHVSGPVSLLHAVQDTSGNRVFLNADTLMPFYCTGDVWSDADKSKIFTELAIIWSKCENL